MCQQYTELHDALTNFSSASDAVICAFSADGGAGLGLPVFGLLVFAFVGFGLTVRVQHPGPLVAAGILSAGLVASSVPGIAARILTLVIFFALSVLGLYLYKRAQTSL